MQSKDNPERRIVYVTKGERGWKAFHKALQEAAEKWMYEPENVNKKRKVTPKKKNAPI